MTECECMHGLIARGRTFPRIAAHARSRVGGRCELNACTGVRAWTVAARTARMCARMGWPQLGIDAYLGCPQLGCLPSKSLSRTAAVDDRGVGHMSLLMASMGWPQAPADAEHRLAAHWAKAGRSCSCPHGLSSLMRPLLLGCIQASWWLHGFDACIGLA
ncbi:hypothetical protein Dimus_030130, partial [Dionaea muscipula]